MYTWEFMGWMDERMGQADLGQALEEATNTFKPAEVAVVSTNLSISEEGVWVNTKLDWQSKVIYANTRARMYSTGQG